LKVGIFILTKNAAFDPIVSAVRDNLQSKNLSTRVDSSSGSVGRRYSRADELGIPFGVTVDFDTLLDDCVTVRERDSMSQVRVPIQQLVSLIQQLVAETLSWETVMSRWPVVKTGGEDEGDEDEGATAAASASAAADQSNSQVVLERSFRGKFSRPNPLYKPK
jgi:glycyl-tRNA synthetase